MVLVPSRSTTRWTEQFGRVITEAQASGAVAVGYASGAIPEVAGAAGLVVGVGRVDWLADEVLRVLTSPGEFERRREAGRRQAATRTWDVVAARHGDLWHRHARGAARARACRCRTRRGSRRESARAEFGLTAATVVGTRPFALPVLRDGGVVPRALAVAIDATAEVLARTALKRRLRVRVAARGSSLRASAHGASRRSPGALSERVLRISRQL